MCNLAIKVFLRTKLCGVESARSAVRVFLPKRCSGVWPSMCIFLYTICSHDLTRYVCSKLAVSYPANSFLHDRTGMINCYAGCFYGDVQWSNYNTDGPSNRICFLSREGYILSVVRVLDGLLP